MKYFRLILLTIIGMLVACNHNNEESLYKKLKIVKELEPQSTVIDWGNLSHEDRQKYPRKGFVINSNDDFPDEPYINLTDLKLMDIDFVKYSLLVQYTLVPGYIKSHRLDWYYDNDQEEYVFKSYFNMIRPDEDINPEYDYFTYFRSAILVNKLHSDSDVIFSTTY